MSWIMFCEAVIWGRSNSENPPFDSALISLLAAAIGLVGDDLPTFMGRWTFLETLGHHFYFFDDNIVPIAERLEAEQQAENPVEQLFTLAHSLCYNFLLESVKIDWTAEAIFGVVEALQAIALASNKLTFRRFWICR